MHQSPSKRLNEECGWKRGTGRRQQGCSKELEKACMKRQPHGSRFCVGQILRVQRLSTTEDFLRLNLKEFQAERRVEHLVPNQIQTLIEFYWGLWFLSA
jgi:hypothetical protein